LSKRQNDIPSNQHLCLMCLSASFSDLVSGRKKK
jgi:hypothetical protein